MTIGPSSSAAQARSATPLKYLKESIMTPSNCPIVHPAKAFLTAFGINEATFHIDYNPVGESILEDLHSEVLKNERPNRKVEIYGTFDEHRKVLERANRLGAHLSINLNQEHIPFVACRAPAGAFLSDKSLPTPEIIIQDSAMFETAYWVTQGGDSESRKDLKDRLDEHFDGDPHFDGATANVDLPGYERILEHGESFTWTPRLVGIPARKPQHRAASEIAQHFKSSATPQSHGSPECYRSSDCL